jgi:oligogalacturonide lyase
MKKYFPIAAAPLLATLVSGCATTHREPPREWIDRDTGHRIVRLSQEPDSRSLYFHQNAYTLDGRLVFTSTNGIFAVDLATRAIEKLVPAPAHIIQVGKKYGLVYYTKAHALFSLDLGTHAEKKIFELPPHWTINTINCDETLAAGTITETDEPERNPNKVSTREAEIKFMKGKGVMMEERLAKQLPMELFFLNLATGEVSWRGNRGTDWLGHLQFSPTDPQQLMFCHEGIWHNVTRTWLIRADGTGLTNIHNRTMQMEIAGHEFWSADGSTAWYDLQTPRSQVFWLAGYEVKTGARAWYNLQRNEWSVHYNCSPDGRLFAGDGGGEGNVARAEDGKWIYLFRPELTPNRMGLPSTNLITTGTLKSERLVNMKNHSYSSLEPNVTFTPDGKWLVFRSDMHGAPHIYAVEVKTATPRD